MAPIRRYLRITKYSVLEVRIYLDNPALAQSWLLNSRDPVLPRVIESIRPLVLPKLREERERERSSRKNKKRSIKDVVVEDDFEVSIFLTGTDTRHSLLYKHKLFRDKTQTKLTSNSSKLTGEGASFEAPIDLGGDDQVPVPGLREESPDDQQEPISLEDIPDIHGISEANRRSKRRRGSPGQQGEGPPDEDSEDDDDNEDLAFQTIGSDSDSGTSDNGGDPPPPKRRKEKETDDKKKLAMDISYEGFSIYGRVLCLVIKRRGPLGGPGAGRGGMPAGMSPAASGSSKSHQTGRPGGQAMMENWITSTQLPEGGLVAGDDDPA